MIDSLGDATTPPATQSVKLIVVNLTHGGSAVDPASWRDLLENAPNAFQVGIIGVGPAQAGAVYDYFGRPVYRYTSEQARADGYLPAAPAGVPDPADRGPEEIDDLEADQFAALEILAEAVDRVSAEKAILRDIALLKQFLSAS
jgi:type I site-specific restriction endonuclease